MFPLPLSMQLLVEFSEVPPDKNQSKDERLDLNILKPRKGGKGGCVFGLMCISLQSCSIRSGILGDCSE